MIRVIIIEDSLTCSRLLKMVLEKSPEILVVGQFSSSEEAIKNILKLKPDLITMDINLPGMSGLEATSFIMETNPIPIILLSNEFQANAQKSSNGFKALDSGALIAMPKPPSPSSSEFESYSKKLIFQVKALSDVKLITRKKNREIFSYLADFPKNVNSNQIPIVAIGASTGGPMALLKILDGLPENFPFPILFVQHISVGFISGMTDWLQNSCKLKIVHGQEGLKALPGHVYAAPDHFHMKIDENAFIRLNDGPESDFQKPSISILFKSVAKSYGPKAIGILLSGMGQDGAYALKEMRKNGALTIAQDESSCGVFGMPRVAIENGAAQLILSPERILDVMKEAARSYIAGELKGNFSIADFFQKSLKTECL
jgi:two-component system chemotaxis response regulator CheB